MKHTIRHDLGDVSRAKSVVEKAHAAYQEKLSQYHPSLTWTDDRRAKISFRVMGKSISVDAVVNDREVIVEAKLPLVFRPFQSKIISVLEREVEEWVQREREAG